MSLQVSGLHDTMVRQMTTSSASTRFNNDFITAFNNVLDDLWATGALDDQQDHIETVDDTVSGLGVEHEQILEKGLVYHLIRLGQKHSGIEYPVAKDEWEDAKGDFMVIERRALQATEDDDGNPSEDVVGLGHLG